MAAKDTPLLTLKPLSEITFYAKVAIPQAAISKLELGQTVHLKSEAYNFYQYGVVKGKLAYVSKENGSNDFNVLVDIPSGSPFPLRSGLDVEGDILVKRIRLSQFIINRILKKMV